MGTPASTIWCVQLADLHHYCALQNWQGAQSIPRDITYDSELNELVFYPIVEVEQLRGQALYMGNATFSTVSA